MSSQLDKIKEHLATARTTAKIPPLPRALRRSLFSLEKRWLEARRAGVDVKLSPWLMALLRRERGHYGYERAEFSRGRHTQRAADSFQRADGARDPRRHKVTDAAHRQFEAQ